MVFRLEGKVDRRFAHAFELNAFRQHVITACEGEWRGNFAPRKLHAGLDVPVLRVPAGPLAISPERRLWVSFFDTPDGVLAVMVGGSVARWDESLAAAEPVLESVRIGDEGG